MSNLAMEGTFFYNTEAYFGSKLRIIIIIRL